MPKNPFYRADRHARKKPKRRRCPRCSKGWAAQGFPVCHQCKAEIAAMVEAERLK